MDEHEGQGGSYEIVDGVRRLIERTAPLDPTPAAVAAEPKVKAKRQPRKARTAPVPDPVVVDPVPPITPPAEGDETEEG